jgi:hypothetical protein
VQIHAAAAGHAYYEDVLLIGHTALLVVDDFAVAIEGEAIFNIAANTKHRDGFVAGYQGGDAGS